MQGYQSAFDRGVFQNFSDTPSLAEGVSMFSMMKDFLLKPRKVKPGVPVPSVQTNLKDFYSKTPAVIWFGHSSYLVHCDGYNILVDPVLSGHASPFSFAIKAFAGSDVYKPKDMPNIDCLLITHNHYDHLDKTTISALSAYTKQVITPLKVGKDIRPLLKQQQPIIEMDWWQQHQLEPGIRLTATPSRHFSGRGLKRNTSLWASFVLEINGYKIFIGSDSGYDSHFEIIGQEYGPFELAILECGQYNTAWPYIHSMPEDLVKEATALRAETVLPVHWAKFALAYHAWDEPINRFVTAAQKANIPYSTPMIGEPVILHEHYPNQRWWES